MGHCDSSIPRSERNRNDAGRARFSFFPTPRTPANGDTCFVSRTRGDAPSRVNDQITMTPRVEEKSSNVRSWQRSTCERKEQSFCSQNAATYVAYSLLDTFLSLTKFSFHFKNKITEKERRNEIAVWEKTIETGISFDQSYLQTWPGKTSERRGREGKQRRLEAALEPAWLHLVNHSINH